MSLWTKHRFLLRKMSKFRKRKPRTRQRNQPLLQSRAEAVSSSPMEKAVTTVANTDKRKVPQ